MKIQALLKKLADKLPWWLVWVINLFPIATLTQQILENPESLAILLGSWGIPSAYITFIVGIIVSALKDSPVEK